MANDFNQPTNTPSSRYNWVGGVVLLVIGVVFLLQNFGVPLLFGNWWAIFIFIPAVIMLTHAAQAYRAGQRSAAAGSATVGLMITIVAVTLLFDLSFGRTWPLFLIVGGIALLLGGAWSRR